MPTHCYVCVHHDPSALKPPLGLPLPPHIARLAYNPILLWTNLCMRPPWVLPEGAATHAFVAWLEPDGRGFRVDASPTGATLEPWGGPDAPVSIPTAVWELIVDEPAAERFVAAARAYEGAGYDWVEAISQPAARYARRVWDASDVICTALTLGTMLKTEGKPAELAVALPDMFPERCARAFREAEPAGWLKRIR